MSPDLTIRPARESDLPRLGALKLESSMAWGDMPEAVRDLPEAREVPADHLPFVLVAELAGEIVGFATVLPRPPDSAELEDIFVAPTVWRRGFGARLIAGAEHLARTQGAGALHVVANLRARGFYEACGFEEVGVVQTLFEPALEMRKAILSDRTRPPTRFGVSTGRRE